MSKELLRLARKRLAGAQEVLDIRLEMRELLKEEARALIRSCSPKIYRDPKDTYLVDQLLVPLGKDLYRGWNLLPSIVPAYHGENLEDNRRDHFEPNDLTNLWWGVCMDRRPVHIFVGKTVGQIREWLVEKRSVLNLESGFKERQPYRGPRLPEMIKDKKMLIEKFWWKHFVFSMEQYRDIRNQEEKEMTDLRRLLLKRLGDLGFYVPKSDADQGLLLQGGSSGKTKITFYAGDFYFGYPGSPPKEPEYTVNIEVREEYGHLNFPAAAEPCDMADPIAEIVEQSVTKVCMNEFTKG